LEKLDKNIITLLRINQRPYTSYDCLWNLDLELEYIYRVSSYIYVPCFCISKI